MAIGTTTLAVSQPWLEIGNSERFSPITSNDLIRYINLGGDDMTSTPSSLYYLGTGIQLLHFIESVYNPTSLR